MEISKNLITTQTSVDPKGLKGGELKENRALFKNQPQNSAQAPLDTAQKSIDDLGKLVNRLLDELKANPSDAKLEQIVSQAKSLQVAPNLAKDLKALVGLAEQNADLKELADKLKAFLKPIAELKAGALNEQIKSSGIMLEANLKDALVNKNLLPPSINKLFGDIKNISNPKLLNQILAIAKDDTLSTQESFSKLGEILQNAKAANKEILNASPVKSLLVDSSKLENIVKFLDKQAGFMSEKGLKLSENLAKTEIGKIGDLLVNLKAKIAEISTDKLSQNRHYAANLKELGAAISDVSKNLDEMLKQPSSLNAFAEQILNSASADSGNLSLQDKLKLVATKLNQALNLAHADAVEAKNGLDEINRLTKQQNLAEQDIQNIKPKLTDEVAKSLQSDVKSTLLSLQSKTAAEPNSQINQQALKLLSQIEMHQIVSSVAGGMQTYMPYIWDGVEGGNISFKQGKKQKHYAQIELNFQKLGAINISLGLSENRYLDIGIATQKEEFKELILSGAKELKRAIGEQGLIVSNFSLKTMPKLAASSLYNGFDRLDMGFDKKI